MSKKWGLYLLIGMFAGLWGCRPPAETGEITPAEIEAHIRFLADDLLEGRAVGSRGHELAVLYQENHFRGLGLEPAFGGGYRQSFFLKAALPDEKASVEVFSERGSFSLSNQEHFVINSAREDVPDGVEGEFVYAGFLIQAPERDWDDLKEKDVKGKVLLVEINEPGNEAGGIFDGEDMTYYGRWTYKFEKASELGATGILIIHNTGGAAYGWEVVRSSATGESCFLPDVENRLFFQGWISGETADRIFSAAGFDRAEWARRAEERDFEPAALGVNVRVRQRPRFRTVETENVAALLRGRHKKHTGRTVILSAHFDHFGIDPALEGDQIYNGAVDNCAASAAMLSLARFYADHVDDLKVDLLFAAVTAEEQGLLGSNYLARHLPVPKENVLANLNFEMTGVWGETQDVYGIGAKQSDLDEICSEAARKCGYRYIPERDGNLGYFFRSDQLSFARVGIPSVWLHEGITSRGGDPNYIQRKHEEFRASRYHKVADEMDEDWDLSGTRQITRWAQAIISLLSERSDLPQFKSSSSFRR